MLKTFFEYFWYNSIPNITTKIKLDLLPPKTQKKQAVKRKNSLFQVFFEKKYIKDIYTNTNLTNVFKIVKGPNPSLKYVNDLGSIINKK